MKRYEIVAIGETSAHTTTRNLIGARFNAKPSQITAGHEIGSVCLNYVWIERMQECPECGRDGHVHKSELFCNEAYIKPVYQD